MRMSLNIHKLCTITETTFKGFWSVDVFVWFLKLKNTLIKQGRNKLLKNDSKDL